MYFLWYLLLGLAAGWIANLIVKGGSSGLFVNLIVGLIGGVLGGWIFSLFGWVPVGTLGSLATAVIGSCCGSRRSSRTAKYANSDFMLRRTPSETR